MEFTSNEKVRKIRVLTDEMFQYVLHDEEPIFFGDEASILDVAAAPIEDLLKRFSAFYKIQVSVEDLRKPLWQSLPELDGLRRALG